MGTGRGRKTETTETTESPFTSSTEKDRDKDNGNGEEAPFYCPDCGRRYEYRRECTGPSPASGHPPREVVSTDELK